MKKFVISLGLSASILFAGTAFSSEKDDDRLVIRDVFVQKVRIADEADKDGDGKISREEFLANPGHDFDELDEDGDGYLDRDERKNSAFSMRSEFNWDAEAHTRLMAELDEDLAEVDERIAEAMERMGDATFGWHGDFDFDGFDFNFSDGDHHRFFSSGWLGDELMESLDDNQDGQVTRDEFVTRREQLFDRLDKNEDGILDEDELADLGLDGAFAFGRFHSEDED